VLAVSNRKGGVGKTASAVNLAAQWAMDGLRVLAWDLDSQANLSTHLGQLHEKNSPSFGVLTEGRAIVDSAIATSWGFDVLAGGSDLSTAEAMMRTDQAGTGRMVIREALEEIPAGTYDVVLLDCPPSVLDMTQAALIAATSVVVPVPFERHAVDGFEKLLKTMAGIARYDNPELKVSCVVETLYDSRATVLANELRPRVLELLDSPLVQPRALLETRVRICKAIAKAAKDGVPVHVKEPDCHAVDDYRALAAEMRKRGGF
jgi:chromosome partitioning protein